MKKLNIFIILLIAVVTLQAQPQGYYNGTDGLTGDDLKLALHNIIADDSHVSYTPGIWTAFYLTDKRPGTDYVWDIYSDIPNGTPPYLFTLGQGDQCGSYDGEGDCYNREHLWPQSWTSNDATEQTDLHHIYPTDGFVNQQRSNYPLGEVNNATWTSQNGSKLGSCKSSLGYSGTVFEPIDEYKGDIARALMYVSVRYYTEDDDWSTSGMTNKSVIKDWAMTMLLRWHEEDPVSEKEINRNEAVYSKQNNRNPFVDNPEFAEMIWNPNWSSTYQIAVAANPVAGGEVSLIANTNATSSIDFSEQGYSDGQVVANATIDDNVSVAFSKGTNANAPKYFNSGTAIRCYGGNNFTVSTTIGSITQIVLTYGSSDGSNTITTNVGSFSTNTWTGDAASVTFTIGGSSGNRRIKAIAVTYSYESAPAQQATCAYGAIATLTATPNTGYHFVNWTKNGLEVSTDAIYSFTVSENATFQANFEINTYDIAVVASPDEGGIAFIGDSPSPTPITASIDFSEQGYTNAQVLGGVTLNLDDNVDVVLNKGTATTAPTYYNTGASIRCYAKNNFVVSTSDGSITYIKLTYGTGDGSNPITVSEGSFVTNEWTGEASSVTFTIGGTNGHRRIHAIEVTYSAGGSSPQGTFDYGSIVTITAMPNDGYTFVNWTKEGVAASTETEYTFTVTEDAVFIANFVESSVTQTITLAAGFNWVSSYVDITLDDLKAALVEAFPGTTGMKIISQGNGYTQYNGSTWRGGLNIFDVTQMYRIEVPEACVITLTGMPVNPAEHPVTIGHGSNWIAFPLSTGMSVANAFAGFPVIGDKIASQEKYTQYNGSIWRGGLQNLEPGNGYIYNSAATESKTFTFPINTRK